MALHDVRSVCGKKQVSAECGTQHNGGRIGSLFQFKHWNRERGACGHTTGVGGYITQ